MTTPRWLRCIAWRSAPWAAQCRSGRRPVLLSGEPTGPSLVACDDEGVVGQVLFSHNLLDDPCRLVDVQVLSPVGVVPGRKLHGIGSALIRHGLDVLTDGGVPLVFLEGSPDYYQRFGCSSGRAHGFRRRSLRIPSRASRSGCFPPMNVDDWNPGRPSHVLGPRSGRLARSLVGVGTVAARRAFGGAAADAKLVAFRISEHDPATSVRPAAIDQLNRAEL